MLNEGQMLLICRLLDEKHNELKKLKNMDINYTESQSSFNSFHESNKNSLVREISEQLGLNINDVKTFFEHPNFNVSLNAQCFTKNSLGNCFYAAPSESILKIVPANYSLLDLDYETEELARKNNVQIMVKTTRTKVSGSQYAVTEELVNIPEAYSTKHFNNLYTKNIEEILNDYTLGLTREAKIKLAIARTNEQFWQTLEKYSYIGTFNNTLVNDWTDYMKFFDEKYGQVMVEKDANGNSLWTNEGFTIYDNRALANGESLALEDQLKLSLHK